MYIFSLVIILGCRANLGSNLAFEEQKGIELTNVVPYRAHF